MPRPLKRRNLVHMHCDPDLRDSFTAAAAADGSPAQVRRSGASRNAKGWSRMTAGPLRTAKEFAGD